MTKKKANKMTQEEKIKEIENELLNLESEIINKYIVGERTFVMSTSRSAGILLELFQDWHKSRLQSLFAEVMKTQDLEKIVELFNKYNEE